MARGDAAHLPRGGPRRRQDVRDAERGAPAPRARRGRRGRLRRDARPREDGRAGRRPRAVPRKRVDYRGRSFEEMDVDAILARRPKVALVDELAHTNVPGVRNEKRWQDVEELLAAGIVVITTLNIQHLESLNDVVELITDVQQRETIPDEVVRRADEIQVVDLTPLALRDRLARGDVYPAERIDTALANYFRPGNLVGAARARAALARRPRRRGARRVPQPLRDRRAVGDEGARARRADRLLRRRTARAARGAARPAREGRPRRRARAPRRTAWPRPRPRCSTASAGCSSELGGTYHEVVGEDVGDGARRVGPRAERDPDRDGREPAVALAAADARLGDRERDPRVRRRHRRARDQPRGSAPRRSSRCRSGAARRRCRAAASRSGSRSRSRRRRS